MTRELAAFLMHRAADALIRAALGLQRLAFRAEFGSDWRCRRELHYCRGITREHYRLNAKGEVT